MAVVPTHLENGEIGGEKSHQKSQLATHAPARVVGVDHRRSFHFFPQFQIGGVQMAARCTKSADGLGDGALAQRKAGEGA